MYAVIRTGGKQYKVQAGDLLVVEKIDGETGADVSFGDVLLLGDGADVTLGAPTVAGASVGGTLIETRKGEKVKIFKKTRRQGYRRTTGHRQLESVIRVTSVGSSSKTDKWDGTVDLTTRAELNARARGLAVREDAAVEAKPAKAAKVAAPVTAEAPAAPAPKKAAAPKAAAPKAAPKAASPEGDAPAKAPAKKAAPKATKPDAAQTED